MDVASDDFNNDVFIIADAFRRASDEDTRLVLNAMAAKKTPSALNDLKFYLIPAGWMAKAWPMLSARPPTMGSNVSGADDGNKWRENVGSIENAGLLELDHAVSSSSDEEGDKKPKAQLQPPPSDSCQLRNGLKHGEDFFLLGPSAWMLVKEKFGSDGVVLGRPCVHHSAAESTLAVAVDNKKVTSSFLVPIPPSGHFPYATMIAEQEGDSEESFLPQGRKQVGQQRFQPAGLKSDVVSDEEGEPNDLFPDRNEPDNMILSGDTESRMVAATAAEPESVLLLPPSTSSNNEGKLYPSVQDMEEEPANKDDVDADGISSAASASSNTRKRHGLGLANLGNTCFMNSSLQCLAHTDPLRKYFLSGDYEKDLNRDNPLGTGGDLATQFANLLSEMWGTSSGQGRNVFPRIESTYGSVIYPRNFKYTLGKHAEQFVGYDQHDSQELATYLLDALHEDTNRVSKKPYIEKPEQGEDEPDEVAANKAWELHLKREDSRVLENFMGLVKSRVSCSTQTCGRVSTTFDPVMYLSLPIPGSTERTLRVTFVPLNGLERKKNLSVTLSKTATMNKLLTKVAEQLMKAGMSANGKPYSLENLCAADIWNHEVYNWYGMDDDIDKIRDSDETYIFEVTPKDEIQKMEEEKAGLDTSEDTAMIESLERAERATRYKLDLPGQLATRDDGWKDKLGKYTACPPMQLMKVLNARRGTNAERYELYQKLNNFLDFCIRETDKVGNKRAREEDDGSCSPMEPNEEPITVGPCEEEEEIPELIERSEKSSHFNSVRTRYDLAMLELCAEKLRSMILESANGHKTRSKEGFEVQVGSRKQGSSTGSSYYSSIHDKGFVNPIVLRVPANMTVYGFRRELAARLSRCLNLSKPIERPVQQPEVDSTAAPEGDDQAPETDVIPMEGDSEQGADETQSGVEDMNVSADNPVMGGDPALLILRQIPLSYKRKTTGFRTQSSKQLGSLEIELAYDSSRPISLASPSDEEEQQLVSDMVGSRGTVFLDWAAELCERVFNDTEYEACDEVKDPDEEEAMAARSVKEKKTVTILDCVEKYCQMEQLEETEMWYCNRCRTHVRAWKQFSLYRAPPILIMHLKRFQYSASSHRRDKINTYIDFPLTGFDLTGHVKEWTEAEKPIYDCYAVTNHYGGLGGGHYTAYCLNDDNVWCLFDDSRITTDIDPKEVVTDAAYVVFYRRRDVEVSGPDFLEGLQQTANIVQDHMDSNVEAIEAPSATAAQDMDVDVNTTDADSHASSKTMESHDGVGNHFADTEEFAGDDADNANTSVVYGGPLRDNGSNFPLQ